MNVELNKEELRVLVGLANANMQAEPDPTKMPKWKKLMEKLIAAHDTDELGRFELHDGSDEKKTEELHKFLSYDLGDNKNAGGPEWDGDPDGVDIWPNWPIHVNIGDTIVKYENSRGHVVYEVERK